MGDFWRDTKMVFNWCWKIFVSIPAIFALVAAIKTIVRGNPATMDNVQYYSSVIFIVIFVMGFIFLVVSYILKHFGRKTEKVTTIEKQHAINTAESKQVPQVSINININSSDFLNKDAEQTRVFLDGVSNIVRESGENVKEQSNKEINQGTCEKSNQV